MSRVPGQRASTVLRGPWRGDAPGLPDSAMMAWAAMTPQPVISSSRAIAGSTGEPGLVPAPGPVTPPASTPQAAGICAIRSLTWTVS